MVECMSTSSLKLFWKSCLVYKEFKSSKSNIHLIDSLMNEFEGKKCGKRILDDSLMTNIRLPRSFVSVLNETQNSVMESYGTRT